MKTLHFVGEANGSEAGLTDGLSQTAKDESFVSAAEMWLNMSKLAQSAIQKGLEQAAEDESEGEDDRAPPEEPCGQEKKVGLPKASKGGKTPGVAATKVPEVSMGATSRPSVTYHVDEVVTAIMAQHAQVKQAAGSSTRVAQQAAPSSLTQAPIQTVDAPPSELVIAGAGMQATPAVGSRPAGNTGVDAGAAFIIDDADLTCTLELSRSSLSSSTSAATAAPPPQSPLQPPPPLQAAAADSLELAPPAVAPESAAATPTSTAPSAAAAATYSMLEAHPNTPQQHLSPAMAHPELLGASAPNPAAPTPRSSSRHDMAGGMVTHTDQQSTSGLRESVAGGVGSVEPLESPRLPEGDADGNAAPPEDATTDQAVCVGSVKLRRTLDDIAAAAVAAVDEVGSEKGADRWSDGDEGSSCCGRSLASNITFGMGVMQTPQPPAESASEPTVPASPAPTAEGPAASSIQCGAATGTNAAGAAGGDSGVPKAMCGADCPKMVGEAEGTPGGVPGVCMALPAPAPPSVVTVAGGEHNEGSSAFSFSLASHTPSDLPQGIMVQALGQEQQAQPPEDATLTPAAGTDGPCTRAPAMEAVVEQAEWQNTFKPWLPQPAPHPPPPPPPSLPSSGASSDPGPGIPPWQVPEGRPKATRRPTPQGPTLPAPASAPTLVPHPPPLAHQQQQSGRHHGQQDPASRLLAQPRPQLQHVDSTLYDKTFGEGARDRDGGIRISGPSLVGADVWRADEGGNVLPPVDEARMSVQGAQLLALPPELLPQPMQPAENTDVFILDGGGCLPLSPDSPGQAYDHPVLAAEAAGAAFPNEAREEARLWGGARRPAPPPPSRPQAPLVVSVPGQSVSISMSSGGGGGGRARRFTGDWGAAAAYESSREASTALQGPGPSPRSPLTWQNRGGSESSLKLEASPHPPSFPATPTHSPHTPRYSGSGHPSPHPPSGSKTPRPIPPGVQRPGKEAGACLHTSNDPVACLPGHAINARPLLHPLGAPVVAPSPPSPPSNKLPTLGPPPLATNPLAAILRPGGAQGTAAPPSSVKSPNGNSTTPPLPRSPMKRNVLDAIPSVPTMPPLSQGGRSSWAGCSTPTPTAVDTHQAPLSHTQVPHSSPRAAAGHTVVSLTWEPASLGKANGFGNGKVKATTP